MSQTINYLKPEAHLDIPIADQLIEEACAQLITTSMQVKYVGLIPTERSASDYNASLISLMETAEVLDRQADPWEIARRGLRRFKFVPDKNKLFRPGGILQAAVMEEVHERRELFNFSGCTS